MLNIPKSIFLEISEGICRPEGSFSFIYTCKQLFDKTTNGLIIEIPAKGHYFRLDRDNDFKLNFYHSSPGTGTRIASIDLNQVTSADTVFIGCTWSPSEAYLYIAPRITNGQLYQAKSLPSKKQFEMGMNGLVYQLGDFGIEVMGASVFDNAKKVLKSSAIKNWRETIKAISFLETGQSDQGFVYEVVICNLTLSMLVTGYKSYSKNRFLELEQEGITPDVKLLLNVFLTAGEREKNLADTMIKEARKANLSLLQYIVDRGKINFQSFKQCKLAYNKAYGIQFGRIGIVGKKIEKIYKYLLYRHKVIHVSPLITIYNEEDLPLAEPVFSKRDFAEQAKEILMNLSSIYIMQPLIYDQRIKVKLC